MIITGLTLTNIKSYAQQTEFIFHPGVNLIKGENGAGKSTLLEAIGYALFAHDPYRPIDNFVRRGARKGKIVVRFVSHDEQEYEVIREIGGEYYAYDPILQKVIARGKDDMLDWLRDRFRVDRDLPLDSLFQNAIGVPQGTMTSDFLKTGRSRADVFNELLRVDSYSKAHDKLLTTVNYINTLLNTKKTEAARLEGQLIQYSVRRNEYQVLVSKIDDLTQQVSRISTESARVSARWSALETLSSDLQRLHTELARLAQQREHQLALRDKAAQALDAAQNAADILRETEESFVAYQVADAQLRVLESDQKQRDALREQLHAVDNELAELRSTIAHTRDALSQVEIAEAELQHLAPLVERQIQLEAELNTEKEREHERAILRRQIVVTRTDLAEKVRHIEALVAQVAQRELIERDNAPLKERLQTLAGELAEIADQRVPLQAEQREHRSQVDAARERVNRYDNLTEQIERDSQRLKRMADRESDIRAELEQRAVLEAEYERISQELQAANDAHTSAKTQIENAQRDLAHLRERQQLLGEQGSVCPVCQQPMDTHAYEQANAHYMLEIDRLERLTENARARQQEAKAAQKTLTKSLETCEQQLRKLELPAALDRHLRDMATLRQELDQAQLECAALADSPDELLRLQQAEEQIEQRLKALEQRHIALEKERVTIQQELDQQHQQLAALPQQAILDRAREEQAELEANLALWNRQLAELDDVDERLRSLQAELTALDDPRVRVRQAHSIADNRPKLEQQLGEQQQRQQALDDQHADLMGQLAQYDQLDQNLQTQREQKLTHEAAYQRYLAYKAEAGKLAERKQEVDSIDIEVTRLTDEMKHWQAQYDALCSDYDAAEHTQLSERKQQLESEYVASCASLAEKQKQLEGLERELKQLQALEVQKAETDHEAKSIEQQLNVLQYFRSQMREAGPHIRKRLVQSISAQAQDYFGDILDDHSHRLVWDPDTYDICVEYSGETRTFNMLSGGEQMSAALAVRLALLTQMTSIRFMFLDEPTTNLDERRRGLLADKLGQIPAIRQLFVISHDSTFQHMDAHTVLVSKFNGISEVS